MIYNIIAFTLILSYFFEGSLKSHEHVVSPFFYTDLLDEYPKNVLCDDQTYLDNIEFYEKESNDVRYAGKEHFLWNWDPITNRPRLEAKLLENSAGHIISSHIYTYDEEGILVKMMINGISHQDCLEEPRNDLLEIIFENCSDEAGKGKPKLIEERLFDEEVDQFIPQYRTINHYDSHGKLHSQEIDNLLTGENHQRIFAYDAWGRVIRTEDTTGKCEEILYDCEGNKLQIERTLLGETGVKRYLYNESHRLIEIEETHLDNIVEIKTLHYHPFQNNPIIPSEETVDHSSKPEPTPIDHKDCRKVGDEWICISDSSNLHVQGDLPEEKSTNIWNKLSYIGEFCSGLGSRVSGTLNTLKEKLSYVNYANKEIDEALHNIFGATFLRLTGYFKHEADSGNFGSGEEVNQKVRLTLINGILNIREDLHLNIHQLSETHGEATVHYVFRPTEGWMSDLLNGFMVKCGYISPQARLLAKKWKELIAEMGGVGEGGKILHYAHSIGGTDTYAAKSLLTPEEQKMIHVFTIGSPTMIPNEGFGSVVNYVSKRDGVCLLDPIGYFNGLWKEDSNVVFLGSFWGAPFVEHTLDTKSYSDLMKALGEQFLHTYSLDETSQAH